MVIKERAVSITIDGLKCLMLPYPNLINILKVFNKGGIAYLIYKCLSILLVDI